MVFARHQTATIVSVLVGRILCGTMIIDHLQAATVFRHCFRVGPFHVLSEKPQLGFAIAKVITIDRLAVVEFPDLFLVMFDTLI